MLNKRVVINNIATNHGLDNEIHLIEGAVNHSFLSRREKKYVGVESREAEQGKLKEFSFLKGNPIQLSIW